MQAAAVGIRWMQRALAVETAAWAGGRVAAVKVLAVAWVLWGAAEKALVGAPVLA